MITYLDLNGNGVDDNEPRLAGLTIYMNVSSSDPCIGNGIRTLTADRIAAGDTYAAADSGASLSFTLDWSNPNLPAGATASGPYPATGGTTPGINWAVLPLQVPVVKIGVKVPLSPSPTATGSPTASPTPSPAISPTPSATASGPSPTLSFTPGPLAIVQAVAVPNPDPAEIRFLLASAADKVTLKIWTPALVLVGKVESGPLGPGWQSLSLGPDLQASLPRGLFYYSLSAQQGTRRSLPRAPGRLVRLR